MEEKRVDRINQREIISHFRRFFIFFLELLTNYLVKIEEKLLEYLAMTFGKSVLISCRACQRPFIVKLNQGESEMENRLNDFLTPGHALVTFLFLLPASFFFEYRNGRYGSWNVVDSTSRQMTRRNV